MLYTNNIILGVEIVHFQQVLKGRVLALVSYLAGGGELTVRKESAVVE